MTPAPARTGWGINPAELDENPGAAPNARLRYSRAGRCVTPVTSEPSNNAAPSRSELG